MGIYLCVFGCNVSYKDTFETSEEIPSLQQAYTQVFVFT